MPLKPSIAMLGKKKENLFDHKGGNLKWYYDQIFTLDCLGVTDIPWIPWENENTAYRTQLC